MIRAPAFLPPTWHRLMIAMIWFNPTSMSTLHSCPKRSRRFSLPIIPLLTPFPFSLTWLEFLPWPLGLDDFNIFYLTAFVSPNIQQLWSMAELQFSGSRRDLAVETGWVYDCCAGEGECVCINVCVGGEASRGGGGLMEKGKNREKRGRRNLTSCL